ncbi:hypothetical protein GCM10025734_05200 [Kitasatospora paranensis]
MTCREGQEGAAPGPEDGSVVTSAFAALLEDSSEDLYEHAPCGYLSTLMDGTIAKINGTLLGWLGLERSAVVGRKRFTDLLTVGGRLYHETHFAPLLQMQGEISGIALEIVRGDRTRMPVLVSSAVKRGSHGEPLLIRTTVFDARDRRSYEEELLRARKAAEEAARQAQADRARLQDALAALQQALLPPCCRRCPEWRRPPTTTPPHPTGSAATSTTSSRWARGASPSSSATCAARGRRLPRSPP